MLETSSSVPAMQTAAKSLRLSGNRNEAVMLYRECLEIAPDDPDILYELGEVLLELDHVDEAVEAFQHALAQLPDDPATTMMLAMALHRQKRLLDSLHFYRRAQRMVPDLAIVHLMAGITATDAGKRVEGRKAFRRALELTPDDLSARLCDGMMHLSMFEGAAALEEGRRNYEAALRELVRHTSLDTDEGVKNAAAASGLMTPFFLAYQGKNDRDLQAMYGGWLSSVMQAAFPNYVSLAGVPKPGEKIRLGFVSSHFYDHSVWKIVTRGWMKYLNRQKFSLYGYYTGNVHDASTEEANSYADVFKCKRDVGAMARAILQDEPHVLIYPELMMDARTLQLAALRLAPVQCAAWGHPVTSGLPTIDCFLSSELMEPPDGDRHYLETLVRLPNLSICYEPLPLPSVPFSASLPGVGAGDVTFLCCQNLVKYLPAFDDIFPAIAVQVPCAKFIFLKFLEEHRECLYCRLKTAFEQHDLSVDDHVIFLPQLDAVAYAALNAGIDIYLDSIGWSGGNTTFESLPFNKPIVTLPGEFMRGRHTAAILRMMGVEETIASSVEEYVAIAVRLAKDKSMYENVSAKISSSKHRVYGDRKCIAALEDFLERACSGAGSFSTV